MIPDARALAEALPVMLGAWALLGLLCAGLGWLTAWVVLGRRGWPAGGRLLPSWPLAAWLGLATLIGVLQLWQIVAPVQGPAVGAVAGLALAGLGLRAWERARGRTTPDAEGAAAASHRWAPWALALLALAVWMAAVRGLGAGLGYDSAYYHHGLAQWFASFRLPPGLANLSPYYGLNLSGLLLVALVDRGAVAGHAHQVTNGFLLILFLALALDRCGAARRRPRTGSAAPGGESTAWPWLVLLFPAVATIHYAQGFLVTTLSTDVLAIFSLLAGWALWLERLRGDSPLDPSLARFASLWLLALSITAKSSTLVLAGLAIAAQVVFERGLPLARRVALALGTSILLLPWIARSVITTGYPFFPMDWLPLPVDWRIRPEFVEGILWNIQGWARSPGVFEAMSAPAGDLGWLPIWWRHEFRSALAESWIPLAVTGAALGLRILGSIRRPGSEAAPRLARTISFAAPGSTLAVAFGVWAVTAPSTRYGQFLFWALAALAAAGLRLPAPRPRWALPALAVAWALAPLAVFGYYAARTPDGPDLRRLVASLRVETADGRWPSVPEGATGVEPMCGGVALRRPIEPLAADGGNWQQVFPWAAEAPVSNFPLFGACARAEGSIETGFRPAPAEAFRAALHETLRTAAARTGWSVEKLAFFYLVLPDEVRRALAAPGPTGPGAVP